MYDLEIEEKIREFFEENYELIQLEGGHGLSNDVKMYALNQVIFYWRKLKDIAEKVTDTEVRLTLPDQRTSKNRRFTIEGIVDVVKEGDETWMYDIKTHDPEYVRSNKDLYEKQLNVYAYIWQHLRENPLHHCAVISTAYPRDLKRAIQTQDLARMQYIMDKWNPVIEIPFDEKRVEETVKDFADIVDLIEDHVFSPASVEELGKKAQGTNTLFATRVCRNCDARFSCSSYRKYVIENTGGNYGNYHKYFKEDFGNEEDHEDWLNAGLQELPEDM